MLIGAVAGIIVGRCHLADADSAEHLDRGLTALAQGIGGRADRFVEAEAELAKASGATIYDGYPLFLLELSHILREGRAGEADPAVRPVIQALARGDVDDALRRLPSVPRDFAGRQHLERVVIELARRASEPGR